MQPRAAFARNPISGRLSLCRLIVGLVAGATIPSAALAHDEADIGRNSKNQLSVLLDFDMPMLMEPSFVPGVVGWAKVDLGLAAVLFDRADIDLFKLPDTADVQVKLVGADDATHIWRAGLAGWMDIGDAYALGHPYFHNHPVFQVDHLTGATEYTLTFVAQDLSGTLADSEPFTLRFQPVPGVGAIPLGLIGAAASGLRRRR